jgi:hypothetical protein
VVFADPGGEGWVGAKARIGYGTEVSLSSRPFSEQHIGMVLLSARLLSALPEKTFQSWSFRKSMMLLYQVQLLSIFKIQDVYSLFAHCQILLDAPLDIGVAADGREGVCASCDPSLWLQRATSSRVLRSADINLAFRGGWRCFLIAAFSMCTCWTDRARGF